MSVLVSGVTFYPVRSKTLPTTLDCKADAYCLISHYPSMEKEVLIKARSLTVHVVNIT